MGVGVGGAGVGVDVGRTGEEVGVLVGVNVAVGGNVSVGAAVGVAVGSRVGVLVGEGVTVTVCVGEAVEVGSGRGVVEGICVTVGDGLRASWRCPPHPTTPTNRAKTCAPIILCDQTADSLDRSLGRSVICPPPPIRMRLERYEQQSACP